MSFDRLDDCASHPPVGVAQKPYTARLIETFRRPQQTQVTFVDQVTDRETVPLVPSCHRDDEPQIGGGQPTSRLSVPGSRTARELELLLAREKRFPTYLVEIAFEDPDHGRGTPRLAVT